MIELGGNNPYVSLFWDMIARGKDHSASDIHVQPECDGVDIRFRIHGELIRWKWIPIVHKLAFLQEAKRLCQCSIAVSGKPQDSRLSVPDLKLDVRVNLVPSLQGEKLVLRLLDQSRSFKLNEVGLSSEATQAIHRALTHGTGVCLITGPTGSGKTTLLYSALSALDRQGLNIATIEDPVEYTFRGVTQIQVNSKISFPDALRAMLRQDPDVILLGEIRDAVTAELCFQAAATGHLVLSTLHANSAKEVTGRLHGLGVQTALIESCLRFSSAQRLVGRLCTKCSLHLIDEERQNVLPSVRNSDRLRKRNSMGCGFCRNGVTGRIPLFEFIDWMPENRETNSENHPYFSTPLRHTALELSKTGDVDIYEAITI